MRTTQYGPGDTPTWGPIFSAADPRIDSLADEEAFEAAVETLCAARIKSVEHINEARGFLPATTDAAIDSAIADALAAEEFDRIPVERLALVGSLLVGAVKQAVRRDAEADVRRDFEQQRREAEEDAARERMEN